MSSILRVVKNRDNPYTMVRRSVIENEELSWEARGMLTYLLGKPDNWTISVVDLGRQSPAGKTKTARILRELEAAGHVARERKHNPATGRFYWESTVYEVPIVQEPMAGFTIGRKTIDGKPGHIMNTESNDIPDSGPIGPDDTSAPEPAQESVPRSNSKKRKRKPVPVSVKAYQSAAHRYPPRAWYDRIDATVGSEQAALDRWKALVDEWVGRGWNPGNVQGMLDAFANGGIRDRRGNGRRKEDPTEHDVQDYVAAWRKTLLYRQTIEGGHDAS